MYIRKCKDVSIVHLTILNFVENVSSITLEKCFFGKWNQIKTKKRKLMNIFNI